MIALLIVAPLVSMFLGMWGGQGFLQARRFIMPALVTVIGILWQVHLHHVWWPPILLLGLMEVLSMGYGDKSWIHGLFPLDWTDRLIYALLVSIPVIVTAISCGHMVSALLVAPALIGAFEVRAGKWFSVGRFDVLWEDIARYLTIGVLCSLVVL